MLGNAVRRLESGEAFNGMQPIAKHDQKEQFYAKKSLRHIILK